VSLGLVVVVVLGLIWVTVTRDVREDMTITECGFDKYGPYAKVRVDGRGGLGVMDHEGVTVVFTYDGVSWSDSTHGITVSVPERGSTTAVLHGNYPPRVITPRWSGRKHNIIVEGHPVYRIDEPFGNRDENWPGRLVTHSQPKEFISRQVRLHPHGPNAGAQKEIVPDDLHLIGCSLPPPDEFEDD
jgi:hypothetical protein